jgi:protocatechuate 3,4-dioxygenase beta subunit
MNCRSTFIVTVAAALLAATLSSRAQTQPRGGGASIAGRVVDEAGHAVPDAVVTIGGRGGPVDRVAVDPRGRFVFRGLQAGVFGVVASRPGYFGGAVDQHDPTSAARPIELTDGQALSDVTLRLSTGGAITGTVTGEGGDPLPGVEIHALRRALVGGRWTVSTGPTTTTDDRGDYRLDGLAPGDYAIVARPDRDPDTALLLAMLSANATSAADIMAGLVTTHRAKPETDDRVRHYAMAFHPAAPTITGASLVAVAAGSERAKTDFRLKASRVVRVSGTLAHAAGAIDGITLELLPADASGAPAPIDAAVTACDDGGRFEFSGVAPGRYLIKVQSSPPQPPAGQPGGPAGPGAPPPAPLRPGGPGAPGQPQALPANVAWSGSASIVVGAIDLANVSVAVQQGVVMSGRVTFEGAAPKPAPAQIAQVTLRLDPVDHPAAAGAATWRGQVDPDGRFRTMSVPPGEYLLRVGAPPRGWTVLSAMAGGIDILDAPIAIAANAIDDVVVTFGDGPLTGTSGTVRDAKGAGAPDTSVLIFPTDRALWRDSSADARRLRLARPIAAGRFGVPGLPAGEYFVVAVGGELPGEWQDPRRLEALAPRATRVRLGPGPPLPIDLTVIVPPGLKTRGSILSASPPGPESRPPSGPAPAKASAQPGLGPSRTAAIAGIVLDQSTHRPAANALVLVAGADVGVVRVTATDARGQFAFAGLPAGHFLIGAGKPSWLPVIYGASRPGRPGTLLALDAGQRVGDVALALVRGGVIAGRVTGDGDRPVPGARVRVVQHRAFAGEVALTGDAGDPVAVTTDADGRYRVFDLPPGEYAVAVQARGIIGGDVRRVTEAEVDAATSVTTARAAPANANGMALGWAPAYFPGTSSPAEAEAIVLTAGETRAHVDVHMKIARFVRVDGTVASSDGAAPPNLQMTLRPRGLNASGIILTSLTTRPSPDGRFVFPNLPPGEYTVAARTMPPPPAPPDRPFAGALPTAATSARWATHDITVHEENVTDIALALRPGVNVSGTIQLAGGARLPADAPLIRVGVRPTPGSAVQNALDAVLLDKDGRFTIGGLVPGRYRIYVQVPNNDVLQVPEWFATTAIAGSASEGDALDVPFDLTAAGGPEIAITLTNDTQELDGVVRDAAGHAARDCTVVVFPVDPRFWFQQSRRIVTRQSDRDGRFVFGVGAGLPVGEYFLAVVPDGRPGEPLDVLMLEELAATAVKVALNANESKTMDLKLIRP